MSQQNNETEESQQHILESCESMHHDDTTSVENKDIFKVDTQHVKDIAKQVEIIMNILAQLQAWVLQGRVLRCEQGLRTQNDRNKEQLTLKTTQMLGH